MASDTPSTRHVRQRPRELTDAHGRQRPVFSSMPINFQSRRPEAIWATDCPDFRHSNGVTNRSPCRRRPLGLLGRCHWKTARIQHQSFFLCRTRHHCRRHVGLHLFRLSVRVASPRRVSKDDCELSVALYSAGAGKNYIIDATKFLEFLPRVAGHLDGGLVGGWLHDDRFPGMGIHENAGLVNHAHAVELVCHWNGFALIQCLFACNFTSNHAGHSLEAAPIT